MAFNSTLSHRIVTYIVILTAIVSGFFTAGVLFVIDFVERNIVTADMELLIPKVVAEFTGDSPQNINASTKLYSGAEIPDYLRGLSPGFTEIDLGDQAFYAYRQDRGPTSYFLVRDQSDFEAWEDRLEVVAVCGFIISIAASFVLGQLMVKKIIAPVRQLTFDVRDREKLLSGQPPLVSRYAEDEVGDLAKAFDSTIGLLHQALQRESLFTSDVSHELRTSLMVVRSSCDILKVQQGLGASALQRLDMIAGATDEMQALVDCFLALARRQETTFQKSTLHGIVAERVEGWRELARDHLLGFVLVDETTAENRGRHYPEVLLRTVLNNLIRNAVQHAGSGEVTLLLTADGFEVRDTGQGIPGGEWSALSSPERGPLSSSPQSIGVGLSLVGRVCERMGWQVAFRDNQPRGCRFIVNLC